MRALIKQIKVIIPKEIYCILIMRDRASSTTTELPTGKESAITRLGTIVMCGVRADVETGAVMLWKDGDGEERIGSAFNRL